MCRGAALGRVGRQVRQECPRRCEGIILVSRHAVGDAVGRVHPSAAKFLGREIFSEGALYDRRAAHHNLRRPGHHDAKMRHYRVGGGGARDGAEARADNWDVREVGDRV